MHAHPQDACSGRMAVHLTRLGRGWHVMGLCAMTKRWSAHTLSFELADVLMCWCAQLYPEVACTSSMARTGGVRLYYGCNTGHSAPNIRDNLARAARAVARSHTQVGDLVVKVFVWVWICVCVGRKLCVHTDTHPLRQMA
jgi:hypothetical protein